MNFKIINDELLEAVSKMLKESKETISLKEELLKEFDEYGMGFDGEDETEYKDIADDEAGADDEEFKLSYESNETEEESPEYIEAFGYLIDNVPDVTEEELNTMPHDILIDMYNMFAGIE